MATPTARAASIPTLEIVVDSHEQYPYRFTHQQVTTVYADFRGINVSGEDPLVRDWLRILTVPSP